MEPLGRSDGPSLGREYVEEKEKEDEDGDEEEEEEEEGAETDRASIAQRFEG